MAQRRDERRRRLVGELAPSRRSRLQFVFSADPLQRPRPGFTLLEMLTTCAALVILLGMMVSLARYVRNASAVDVTKSMLHEMDRLMAQYVKHHDGRPPAVVAFIASQPTPDENALQKAAWANNREVIAALRSELSPGGGAFGGLPDSIYDEASLRDAWGSPIVFMPTTNVEIGLAPNNRAFFFSAGPDRRYLTLDDNLYSYEDIATDKERAP